MISLVAQGGDLDASLRQALVYSETPSRPVTVSSYVLYMSDHGMTLYEATLPAQSLNADLQL